MAIRSVGPTALRPPPWTPPGPVARQFFLATPRGPEGGAGGVGIEGPVGSGKTLTALAKCIWIAAQQPPEPTTGIRTYRWGIVRRTYRELHATTIRSWEKLLGRADLGLRSGGSGDPVDHLLNIQMEDGTLLNLEMCFRALSLENNLESVLKGVEVSSWLFDEADMLDREALSEAISRAGRYPDKMMGRSLHPWWFGLVCVLNAPDMDHWICDLIDAPPDNWQWYRQPGGRSPGAENVKNLVPGYYEGQVAQYEAMGEQHKIARKVDNQRGYSRDGKPVYADCFAVDRHVSTAPLRFLPDLPLKIGADAGLKPAAVITQTDAHGQRRYLAELVEEGCDAAAFGAKLARLLHEVFGPLKVEPQGWCEPAAVHGTENSITPWIDIVSAESGVRFRPAPGNNNVALRIQAVADGLRRSIVGGQPAVIIDRRCRRLIHAYASGYQFRRKRNAAAVYEDVPSKNDDSHVADAAQYVELGSGAYAEVRSRRGAAERRARVSADLITDLNAWRSDRPSGSVRLIA